MMADHGLVDRVVRWLYHRERTGVWLFGGAIFVKWMLTRHVGAWRSPSVAGFQVWRVLVQVPPLRDRGYDGKKGIERLRRERTGL